MNNQWDKACWDFIDKQEGNVLKAYWDDGWACGRGIHAPDVTQNTIWTAEESDARFKQKLDEICKGINNLVNVSLAQCQFDSICSFCYNLGVGAFEGSTMLRLLNEGAYGLAAAEFPRWDKIHDDQGNVVVSADLRTRRLKEQAMFLNKPYVPQG